MKSIPLRKFQAVGMSLINFIVSHHLGRQCQPWSHEGQQNSDSQHMAAHTREISMDETLMIDITKFHINQLS